MSIPKYMRPHFEAVAAKHGLFVTEFAGPSRTHKVAHARQELYFVLMSQQTHLLGPYSSTNIGRILNRDHTTVLSGRRAHISRQEKLRGKGAAKSVLCDAKTRREHRLMSHTPEVMA